MIVQAIWCHIEAGTAESESEGRKDHIVKLLQGYLKKHSKTYLGVEEAQAPTVAAEVDEGSRVRQ